MGGILMGRALVERPDLFAAAHIAVGAVNPLRNLAAENGANQITEVGDPRIEADDKSILAFDPYVNIKAAHCVSGGDLHDWSQRSPGGAVDDGEDGGAASRGDHESAPDRGSRRC